MADREKIQGKVEIQTFDYLENENGFLDKIKFFKVSQSLKRYHFGEK